MTERRPQKPRGKTPDPPSCARGDVFDWKPEMEIVLGPLRPAPSSNLRPTEAPSPAEFFRISVWIKGRPLNSLPKSPLRKEP
jgi:hypothetical protein